MAPNPSRAQRMRALPVPALLDVYLSGSLSSAAAAAELIRRGVPLPTSRRVRQRIVEVIYGPVPMPSLREQLRLQESRRVVSERRGDPDPAAPSPRPE